MYLGTSKSIAKRTTGTCVCLGLSRGGMRAVSYRRQGVGSGGCLDYMWEGSSWGQGGVDLNSCSWSRGLKFAVQGEAEVCEANQRKVVAVRHVTLEL